MDIGIEKVSLVFEFTGEDVLCNVKNWKEYSSGVLLTFTRRASMTPVLTPCGG